MKPRPAKRPVVPGVLIVIVSLMLVSGLLKGGLGANKAIALSTPPEPASADPVACEATPLPAELAKALSLREEKVSERESALKEEAAEIARYKKALSEQILRLQNAEAQLRDVLAIAESASEKDLTQLTSVYEAMKPSEAATLFEEMDPEFAAGFLGRMAPSAAAGILAGVDPATAYAMSAHLAGRNAHAPTE